MYSAPRFVYAFHSPSLASIKFGSTNNVRVRLQQLRWRHKVDLNELVALGSGHPGDAIWLEQAIHNWLSSKSIKVVVPGILSPSKEWYPDNDKNVLEIVAYLREEAFARQVDDAAVSRQVDENQFQSIDPEIKVSFVSKAPQLNSFKITQSKKTPEWTSLGEAALLAFHIHGEQMQKGTNTPYVSHLIGVASLAIEYGGDEDQACAAMLHDAIDGGGAEWEAVILKKFGSRVTAIVRACADVDALSQSPWRVRKEVCLAHLESEEEDALLVSAADKLHNVRTILADLRTYGPSMFCRFNAGQKGTLWYYDSVAEVLARRLPGPLTRELSESVSQMHTIAEAALTKTI